jgi:hypothetical protein
VQCCKAVKVVRNQLHALAYVAGVQILGSVNWDDQAWRSDQMPGVNTSHVLLCGSKCSMNTNQHLDLDLNRRGVLLAQSGNIVKATKNATSEFGHESYKLQLQDPTSGRK